MRRDPSWRQETQTRISDDWIARRYRRERRKGRAAFLVVLILLLAAAGGLGYWYGWFPWLTRGVHLKSVVFAVNDRVRRIPDEGVLDVVTSDRVQLTKIETDAVFDWGVDFDAKAFSRDALLNGGAVGDAISESGWMLDAPRDLEVLYRGRVIGKIEIRVKPSRNYWIFRAEQTDNPRQRIRFLERQLGLTPDSLPVHKALAALYEQVGAPSKAIAQLEWLAAERPTLSWLVRLERLYRREGCKAKRARVLEQIVRIKPGKEYLILAARTFETLGRTDKAIHYYRRALPLLEELDRAAVYKKIGYLWVGKGELVKAVQCYERAAKNDPKDANVQYNLGLLYASLGKTKAAVAALKRAETLEPSDPEVVRLLMEQYEKLGDFRALIPYLKREVKERPRSPELHLKLARAYEKTGNTARALEEYETVARLAPQDVAVRFRLAELYYTRRDFTRSLHLFRQVLELDPDHPKANAYLFRIYKRTGREDRAVEAAQRQLEKDPKDRPLYDYLYRKLRDRDEERLKVILEEGIRVFPADPCLREYLGMVFLKEENIPYAVDQLEQASKLRPGDVSLWYRLAKLYETMGLLDKAQHYYERVIGVDANYRDAEQSFLRLRYRRLKGAMRESRKGSAG